MKIALGSDLHLHCGDINLKNEENADVLILGGDICEARTFKEKPKNAFVLKDFFRRVAFQFPHVVYVMGNHEHYNYDFAKTKSLLEANLKDLPNVHVLEKETFTLNDVTFVGGTLWTDMNKLDEATLWHVGHCMNDFRCVKNSNEMIQLKNTVYAKDPDGSGNILRTSEGNLVVERVDHYERPSSFTTKMAADDHAKMLAFIDEATKKDGKYVVVTHHQPTKKSIKPEYEHDVLMNGGYSSDLEDFIIERPQIKAWTSGHCHTRHDILIGETRCITNARGYFKYESIADDFELYYFEV